MLKDQNERQADQIRAQAAQDEDQPEVQRFHRSTP